jgi:hypothetical protein
LEGRISKLSLEKENKLKEGSWEAYKKRSGILCVFSREKMRRMSVRKKIVFMCERVLFMEKMYAKKKNGRKLCVANSCNRVHGRISMNKPLDSYFKYFFLSNPLLDFFQDLNNFNLRSVKCSLKISTSLGLLQGELHLPKVEGVELFVF